MGTCVLLRLPNSLQLHLQSLALPLAHPLHFPEYRSSGWELRGLTQLPHSPEETEALTETKSPECDTVSRPAMAEIQQSGSGLPPQLLLPRLKYDSSFIPPLLPFLLHSERCTEPPIVCQTQRTRDGGKSDLPLEMPTPQSGTAGLQRSGVRGLGEAVGGRAGPSRKGH